MANNVYKVTVGSTTHDIGVNTAKYTTTPTTVYLVGADSQTATSANFGTVNGLYYSGSGGYLVSPAFYASSDRRLKENIKEFIPQQSILDLPIVEYDFKSTGRHDIGCIAQDLQEICPEIVSEGPDGFLSIAESKLVYLLLDELKKVKAEVGRLNAELTELKLTNKDN
jgi:hypothetical protein